MCGRFALNTSIEEMLKMFDLEQAPEFAPRFNIAPRTEIAAVRLAPQSSRRELVPMLWWMIPAWAKKLEFKYPTFNAVSETAAEKPTYRDAFKKGRRCLVPADGFYEWKGPKGDKQPYFFHVKAGGPLAMAGLWEHWEGEGKSIDSCTILTTEANEIVRPIHERNRMPVILEPEQFARWLDPATSTDEIQSMCVPLAAEKMDVYPVGKLVNSVKNEGAELMERI